MSNLGILKFLVNIKFLMHWYINDAFVSSITNRMAPHPYKAWKIPSIAVVRNDRQKKTQFLSWVSARCASTQDGSHPQKENGTAATAPCFLKKPSERMLSIDSLAPSKLHSAFLVDCSDFSRISMCSFTNFLFIFNFSSGITSIAESG